MAIIDISKHLRSPDGGLKPGTAKWLRDNLPAASVEVHHFPKVDARRAGSLLAVRASAADMVGLYAAHLRSGKDFRVRWSELPDAPDFDYSARLEMWWRRGWITTSEAKAKGGVGMPMRARMNYVQSTYKEITGEYPTCSWPEAEEFVAKWREERDRAWKAEMKAKYPDLGMAA
jgi:hypothetical protein